MSSLFVHHVVPPPFWMGGHMALQPIVTLTGSRPVHGFEALARPDRCDAEQLIETASAAGARELYALESSLLRSALLLGCVLPPQAKLFVNVHPSTFEHERFASMFLALTAAAPIEARRLVVEITEHAAFRDAAQAIANATRLRERGVSIALDDVATTGEHLEHTAALAPTYMKIGRDIGTDFECDPVKVAIVQSVARLAGAAGARLIVEGIEHASTMHAARALGITLGQGYYFAQPRAPRELFESRMMAAVS